MLFYFYRRSKRKWIPLLVFFIPMAVIGWNLYQYFTTEKFVVLVAKFDSSKEKNYRVTDTIIDRLREATKGYEDVQVRALDDSISNRDEAHIIGKKENANIVIWGWYGATEQAANPTVCFQVLQRPRHLELDKDKVTYNVKIAQLDTFSFQTDLANKMGYLTLLTLGLKDYEMGDYEKAIERFSGALQSVSAAKAPKEIINPAFIYLCRGNAYFLAGDYAQAYDDYNLAFKPKSEPLNSGTISAHAEKEDGHNNLAIADYDTAIVLDPRYAVVYNNRGLLFKLKGDTYEAIRSLTKAITIDSSKALFYVNRGATYADEDSFAQAIADFDHAIRLNNEDYSTYFNRGNVHLKKGDYDHAIADFTQTLKLNPKYHQAYNYRGLTYLTKGDFQRAIRDFTKAIKLNPESHQAYKNRGRTYQDKGDYDRAIRDFEQARKIKPDDPELYYSLGDAIKLKNEQRTPRKIFEPSNKHEYPDTIPNIAVSGNTRPSSARDDNFKQAAKSDSEPVETAEPAISDEKPSQDNTRLTQYSELPESKEDSEITPTPPRDDEDFEQRNDGLDKFDRAYPVPGDTSLNAKKKLADKYFLSAWDYVKRKEYARAIAEYNKGIQLVPNRAEAYRGRGDAYYNIGAYELTIMDCTQAIRLKSKDALTYYLRGCAYEKNGDLKHAAEDFEAVLKFTSDHKLRIAAEKRLKKYRTP